MRWLNKLFGLMFILFLVPCAQGRIVCSDAIPQDASLVFSIFMPADLSFPQDENVKLEKLRQGLIDFIATELKIESEKITMVLDEVARHGSNDLYKNITGIDCAIFSDQYNHDIAVYVKAKDANSFNVAQNQKLNKFVKTLANDLSDTIKLTTSSVELNSNESAANTSVLVQGKTLINVLRYKDEFIYTVDERPLQKVIKVLKEKETTFAKQGWVSSIEESGLGDFGQLSLYYPQQDDAILGKYYQHWCHNFSFSENNRLEIRSFGRSIVSPELKTIVDKLQSPSSMEIERYRTTGTQLQLCVQGLKISDIYAILKRNQDKMSKVAGLIKFVDSLEKSLAVNLRDFLDDSLGKECSFQMASGDEVLSSSYVMIASIKDEALLKMLTGRIKQKVAESLHRYAASKMGGVKLDVKSQLLNGMIISYMPIPNKSMFLPAYACFDNKAMIASSPDVIRSVYHNRENSNNRMISDLTGHFYLYGQTDAIKSFSFLNNTSIESMIAKGLLDVYRECAVILSCQGSVDALVAISVLQY